MQWVTSSNPTSLPVVFAHLLLSCGVAWDAVPKQLGISSYKEHQIFFFLFKKIRFSFLFYDCKGQLDEDLEFENDWILG